MIFQNSVFSLMNQKSLCLQFISQFVFESGCNYLWDIREIRSTFHGRSTESKKLILRWPLVLTKFVMFFTDFSIKKLKWRHYFLGVGPREVVTFPEATTLLSGGCYLEVVLSADHPQKVKQISLIHNSAQMLRFFM